MRNFIFILLIFVCGTSFSQTLNLYGGKNHDVYLGCLNCNDYDVNSIWNEYGTYGSEYSSYSPFNAYTLNPPVVVDKQGNFYGYFTINSYNSQQANFGLAKTVYKFYKEIRKDVKKWYGKIFE